MRRLRKIIFNGLTMLSLLLFVAAVALWVRSYTTGDIIHREHSWTVVEARRGEQHWRDDRCTVLRGKLFLMVDQTVKDYSAKMTWWINRENVGPTLTWGHSENQIAGMPRLDATTWERIGLFYANGGIGSPGETYVNQWWAVGVPCWLITSLFAVLPAISMIRRRQRRRTARLGLCPVCGYDLRSSPERCPECGTPAALKESA